KPSSNSCREKPTKLRNSSMTRSPSVRYYQILTFSDNRLLVPAFSNTADGLRGVPRWPSADGVTRLPSPLPYVFHLQGIAPKLLTHRRAWKFVALGGRAGGCAHGGRSLRPSWPPLARARAAPPSMAPRLALRPRGHTPWPALWPR